METQPTTSTNTQTMNLEHETQTFDTDFDNMSLEEAKMHRFVDDEYNNVLYVLATRQGWVVNVADINEEKQTQS